MRITWLRSIARITVTKPEPIWVQRNNVFYVLIYIQSCICWNDFRTSINHVHDYRIYHSSGENSCWLQGLHEKIEKGKTPDNINIKKFTINIKTQERQMLLKQIFNTLYEITSIYLLKLLLFIC